MKLRSNHIIPVRENPQQPQNHSDDETVIDPQIVEIEMGERVEPENPVSRTEETIDAKVSHKKSKKIGEPDITIDPEIAGKEMGDRVEQEIAGSRKEEIVEAEVSAQSCKENREPDISLKEMEKQQLQSEEKRQKKQQEVEEEEIPESGKVRKKYTRGFSISVKCSMSKVGGLFESESLTQNEMNNLKSSCFQYFVELQTTEIHMITSVVSEIVRARVRAGKLKYQIAGKELQFKPLDVTLILGLKIGPLPLDFIYMEKDVPTEFRKVYFGSKSITEKRIKDAIELARKEPLVDKDDIHRLNRLFLLSTCLMPDASLTIDVRYADLASNLKDFDAFPWGTVVFELLEKSLDAAATHENNNQFDYGLAGCVLAFIIWAYIHLPCLGPRRLKDAPLFPRMLGWKNLPGKTTGRGTIHKKLHPLRGRQIEVAPRFLTPYEDNLPIVIEAKQWQEKLDKQDVPSLEGIMHCMAAKIDGVAATVGKILNPEEVKCRASSSHMTYKNNTTKNKKEKSAPAREDVHINKKKPAAALSGKSGVNTISRSLGTTKSTTSMDNTNTAPTTSKGKPSTTPKGKGRGKTPPTKKKPNDTSTPSPSKKSSPKKKGKQIIDIVEPIHVSLGGIRTRSGQGKQGVQEAGFVLKKRKAPERKKAEEKEAEKTEEEKQRKAGPAKKQRVFRPPTIKQPHRIKLTDINTKNEERNNLLHEESRMERPKTTKKRKVDEKYKRRVEETDAEAAEKEDVAVDGLANLGETNDLLDSTISTVQDQAPLNSDLNAEIELNEDDQDSMDEEDLEDVPHEKQEQEESGGIAYEKAVEDFNRSEERLGKKAEGNKEAKKISAKLSKIMAISFLDRTTTKKQTDSLNYYWRLNDKSEYKNRVMMIYVRGLEVGVNHFQTLENPNWLVAEIIEAYICLLIRWNRTMTEKTHPEEQYAIVPTVYFSTLVAGPDMYGNYTKLMKDKTFVALSPKDRIRTGKLKLRGGPINMLKKVLEMQDQVNLFKAKGILIPCQVNGNHWILLKFSFAEGKVSVYDSLGFKRASKQQIALEKMLPYLVWATDPGCRIVDLEIHWKREYVKCAKQDDGGSCGAYLLAFVDCILRGRSPSFDREPVLMRNRIAMDLVECGVEAPELRKKIRYNNFLPVNG